MSDTIHITLLRSPIGTNKRVRQTLKGLGLGRVGSAWKLPKTPQVMGMVRRVAHLVGEIKN
jgi:large subunit ribosomal protein L30